MPTCRLVLQLLGVLAATVLSTTSNGLVLAGEPANYYVAVTGDDANPGTQEQPFKTIAKGAGRLGPGKTLHVAAGTYTEEFYNGVAGGSSWAQPATLNAEPARSVTIRPAAGAGRVFTFASAASSYIVVNGFILDATNVTYEAVKITWGTGTGASHHVRLLNCEVKNAPGQGLLVTGDEVEGDSKDDSSDNEFIGLDVHDNGRSDLDHGLYISSSRNLVDGCRIYRNAGWGVHVYDGYPKSQSANDNVLRGNWVYNNAGVGKRGPGIGIYTGKGNIAYNNVVWGNNSGIAVNYAVEDTKVYNNTVYANGQMGIDIGGGDETITGSANAIVRNNAVWKHAVPISDNGTGTVQGNNCVRDPQFADAAGGDFRLRAGSPAIDTGATLPEVKKDIAGTPRPQGVAYDIGAYEFWPGTGDFDGNYKADVLFRDPSSGGVYLWLMR